jgi:hypothetical protein
VVFCRNVERRNYTFYCLVIAAGVLRVFLCYQKNLFVELWKAWNYSFGGVVIITLMVYHECISYYYSRNLGSVLTFEKFEQSAGSALLSLIVGLFFYFQKYLMLTHQKFHSFIGTSFIGMVSSKFKGAIFVYCQLFSSIYINKSHFFQGFGGALGTLAFISLLTTICF